MKRNFSNLFPILSRWHKTLAYCCLLTQTISVHFWLSFISWHKQFSRGRYSEVWRFPRVLPKMLNHISSAAAQNLVSRPWLNNLHPKSICFVQQRFCLLAPHQIGHHGYEKHYISIASMAPSNWTPEEPCLVHKKRKTVQQWAVYWWPRAKSSVCDYRRECLLPMGRKAPQWHPSIQYKTNHTNFTLCTQLNCTWPHHELGTILLHYYVCTATPLQASKLPAATTWVSRWPIFWFKLLSSHLCGWIGLHLSIIPSQCCKMIHYQWIQGAIFALDLHSLSEKHNLQFLLQWKSGKTC